MKGGIDSGGQSTTSELLSFRERSTFPLLVKRLCPTDPVWGCTSDLCQPPTARTTPLALIDWEKDDPDPIRLERSSTTVAHDRRFCYPFTLVGRRFAVQDLSTHRRMGWQANSIRTGKHSSPISPLLHLCLPPPLGRRVLPIDASRRVRPRPSRCPPSRRFGLLCLCCRLRPSRIG